MQAYLYAIKAAERRGVEMKEDLIAVFSAMKKIKKQLIVIFSVVVVLVAIYLIMFFNTDPVMQYAKNVMEGNVPLKATAGLPVDRYNQNGGSSPETVSVKVELHRVFVLHDFSDGYMWVNYTQTGYDSKGNITYGSWHANSCWKIHKHNGKWEIVAIYEGP